MSPGEHCLRAAKQGKVGRVVVLLWFVSSVCRFVGKLSFRFLTPALPVSAAYAWPAVQPWAPTCGSAASPRQAEEGAAGGGPYLHKLWV